MKLLRYAGAALLSVGLLGAVWVVQQPGSISEQFFDKPCSTPLAYTVGEVDPSFGITKEEFVQALQTGSNVWNEAAGKQVLVYDPSNPSAIPVHLVYDQRQENIRLGEHLDSEKASLDTRRAEIERLDAIYTNAQNIYEKARTSYETAAASYQAEVARVNKSGGATPKEYERLQAQQAQLQKDQEKLNSLADALNAAGKDLQIKVAALNESVKQVNSVVSFFNTVSNKDFDAGKYVLTASSTKITIYSYSSKKELIFELAHEFGHALGMEHNDNPESIMFAYAKSETLSVSAEDLASLRSVCEIK